MKTTRRRAGMIALLPGLAALAATLPVAAQPAQPSQAFVDRVDVRVVNLEVVVTDKQGRPITDLTKDDFEILEDGRPVELTNFFAIHDNRLAESAAADPGDDLLPAVTPPDRRVHLVLYLDNETLDPTQRNRVVDRLTDRIPDLVGDDRKVMVASYSRSVSIDQPFTDQPEQILAALEQVRSRAAGNLMRNQRRRILSQLTNFRQPEFTEEQGAPESSFTEEDVALIILNDVRGYAAAADAESRRNLAALEGFVSSLAGLPGRKVVLLVSAGAGIRPAEDLFRAWFEKYGAVYGQRFGVFSPESESGRYDSTDLLQKVASIASSNGVRVYGFDAVGGRTALLASAEFGDSPPSLGIDTELASQESLLHLAAATGGKAMLGSPNVSGFIDQLSEDLASYYSLGYTSPKNGDGRYHRVKVKVKREGVRVRHAEGYLDRSPQARMADTTMSALLLDVTDNPLGVRLQLGDKEKAEKGNVIQPVLVRVPISRLVLLPNETTHEGRLTVFVAVKDGRGRTSKPQQIDVPVSIPNDRLLEAMVEDIGYGVRLLMRPGSNKLAVGVRDELADLEATVNLSLDLSG